MRGFKDLKGYAAECTNQNYDFSKELIKTQFCGCNPYNGGEPCYIWCCGSLCCFVMFFHALMNIYLINKITTN